MYRPHCVLVVALSLGFTGCAMPSRLLDTPGGAPTWMAPAPAGIQNVVPASELGTLRLAIRWPLRDLPGFRAQAIPHTTNALVVRVRKGTSLLAEQVLVREPGAATSSVAMSFKADSNLSVEVKAYRETSPDPDVSVPIAQGAATGVNLVRSQDAHVALTLDALFAPTIISMSANAGAVGDVLTLTGTNFGAETVPFKVSFNGTEVPALSATRSSETQIQVAVPAGATVGNVRVTADGIPSISTSTFWVARSLEIGAARKPWERGPADTRVLLLGDTLHLVNTPAWAGEPSPDLGAPPQPAWRSDDPDRFPVDNQGRVTATVLGYTGSVRATMGSLTSNALHVTPLDVEALQVQASGKILGSMGDASLNLRVRATLSDGVTYDDPSLATFTPSDPVVARITAAGLLTSVATTGNATFSVLATAVGRGAVSQRLDLRLVNAYQVSTYAGTGAVYGNSATDAVDGTGINGSLLVAQFAKPTGMAVTPSAGLLVADANGGRIRKLEAAGSVTTLARNGTSTDFSEPYGIAYDHASGKVYVSNYSSGYIRVIASNGAVSTLRDDLGATIRFTRPCGLALDASGSLFVADPGANKIYRVLPGGKSSVFSDSGLLSQPKGLAVDVGGTVYVCNFWDGNLVRITSDGSASVYLRGMLYMPASVAVDTDGNIFALDTGGHKVKMVTPSGTVRTVAGSGLGFLDGPGWKAQFNTPEGLAVDASGRVFVSDSGNQRIRLVAP